MDLVAELERLSELRKNGALTDAEYETAKAALLKQAGEHTVARGPDSRAGVQPGESGDHDVPGTPPSRGMVVTSVVVIAVVLVAIAAYIFVGEDAPFGESPEAHRSEGADTSVAGSVVAGQLRGEIRRLGVDVVLECPRSVRVEPGVTFTCMMNDAAEPTFRMGRVEAEIQDGEGTVYWQSISTRPRSPDSFWGDGPFMWESEGLIEIRLQ